MRRLRVFFFLSMAAALAACGNETPAPAPTPDGPAAFKVMTQNLYLGGDLDLITAPGADVPQAVDEIWASVQATDFNRRAKVLVDGIQAEDPDLVGLQEVSLWRTQIPGDHLPIPDATIVAYDFLDILVRELASRGLAYRVVLANQNGDAELSGASGNDYRLTDRDAVLAKTSLPIVSASSGTYAHLGTIELSLTPGAAPTSVTVPRGWVMVEFRSGGKTVRYVNTHLEAFSADVASRQALDLMAVASPTTQPTIVAGDMNLPPDSPGYAHFVAPETGLSDTWSTLKGADPGLTCCWNPDLKGGGFDKRIDLEFSTSQVRPTSATIVNDTERTPDGLAPSDHAGVVIGFTTAQPAAAALVQAGGP